MPKPPVNPHKIVVITGAGISAASGLATFRDAGGLWTRYDIRDVATPEGWNRDPALVLDFYNQCRQEIASAQPNPAHQALASLEDHYEVIIFTQNIDDLHERVGSRNVFHMHGDIRAARGTQPDGDNPIVHIGTRDLQIGDLCPNKTQLRPDIVWFGEDVYFMPEARQHLREAARVLFVGTSLQVSPVNTLVKHARYSAEKIIVNKESLETPYGYRMLTGAAETLLPDLARQWNAAAVTNLSTS